MMYATIHFYCFSHAFSPLKTAKKHPKNSLKKHAKTHRKIQNHYAQECGNATRIHVALLIFPMRNACRITIDWE